MTNLPVIVVNPTSISITEKDTVELSCGYEDNRPSLTVFKWRFVDKSGTVKIVGGTNVPKDRYSGLTITSVNWSAAGSYACMVGMNLVTYGLLLQF